MQPSQCQACSQRAVLVCARCKRAGYCSKPCQTRAWKAGHRARCVPARDRAALQAELQLVTALQWAGTHRQWEQVLFLEPVAERTPCSEVNTAANSWIIGNAHDCEGNYPRAMLHYRTTLAICEALQDLEPLSAALLNIGMLHTKQGEYEQALQITQRALEVCGRSGDRETAMRAHGNLALVYENQGRFAEAIACNERGVQLHEEGMDPDRVHVIYNSLGTCHLHLREYEKAAAYFRRYLAFAESTGNERQKNIAWVNLGLAAMLEARAARARARARAARMFSATRVFSGARMFTAARAFGDEPEEREAREREARVREARVREARGWLATAAEGCVNAQLHLAQLLYETGHAHEALRCLKAYLTHYVELARTACDGCGLTRSEDAPMLTCSGCRVARFCSVEHQKMSSKKAAGGGCLWKGRHKDVCAVLGTWRRALKLYRPGHDCALAAHDRELLAYLRAREQGTCE